MKSFLCSFGLILLTMSDLFAQKNTEFMQMTTIESVVPGGLGRSRMISTGPDGKIEEVVLENFFSLVGINFGNIKDNDQKITGKINALSKEGWELLHVNSGVYGADKSTGIFVTRYVFRRPTSE